MHQCATPMGSVSREVEIFVPMFDPAGVDELLDEDFCSNVRRYWGRLMLG
jgi:hypothetical protein